MPKKFVIQELGFDYWLELYTFLVECELSDLEEVELYWPNGCETVDGVMNIKKAVLISVDYIKARAFDELYHKIPMRNSVEVLIDIFNEENVSDKDVGFLITFLRKMPTKEV